MVRIKFEKTVYGSLDEFVLSDVVPGKSLNDTGLN